MKINKLDILQINQSGNFYFTVQKGCKGVFKGKETSPLEISFSSLLNSVYAYARYVTLWVESVFEHFSIEQGCIIRLDALDADKWRKSFPPLTNSVVPSASANK